VIRRLLVYRPSFRMILFIMLLSAGHMAAMAPLKVSTTRLPQEAASQPIVRAGVAVSSPSPFNHAMPTKPAGPSAN
jgi:hypothetical protein